MKDHLSMPDAFWRMRAADVLPSYAADESVMSSVAALLRECDGSTLDGSAEALAGILSDAAGLAVWSSLPNMSHGDVSPERDYHGWVRDVVATFRADGSPVDTVPTHQAAPDAIEGSRHTVRRGRNKRGATAVVTARGVANVIGSWTHDACGGLTPERLEHTATILGVRSGAYGCNALDVQRVTAFTYERSAEIPALEGTDAEAWRTVIHAGNGATDDYGVTHHNPRDLYGAAGLPDDRTVGAITYPTRGAGLLRGLPETAVSDRNRAIAWIASHRDRDVCSAAREASRCDVQTFVPSLARQTTRRRLTVPRKRKHDVSARTLRANSYCWTVTELLAPAADVDHVWRGHSLVARPAAIGGTTVRGKRTRTARVARTRGETFHAADRAELLARFATLAAGERCVWQMGALTGTYTVSPNRRLNIGIKWTSGDRTASRRTATAIERIVARCEHLATVPA